MAEGGEDGQERAYDATPRRIERARDEGDLPRSQDAQTAVAYAGFALAVGLGGAWAATTAGEALMAALAHPQDLADDLLTTAGGGTALPGLLLRVAGPVLALLAAPAVLILVLLVAERGIVLAPGKLAPKLSRISPLENAKQKYGVHGLVEFLKATVKLAAIGVVLALAVMEEARHLGQYAAASPRALGLLLERQFWAIMTGVLMMAAAIGALDFFWQRFQHLNRLRMTHEELKEESKEAEGDPHMRQTRRERAREIATNRMLLDVPKADVVITNPTHVAVALVWDRAKGTAPRCVAKGEDEIALRIREIAARAGVPLHEDPPTARSLQALVGIGEEVRAEHYRAVAAAILFADQIRARSRDGWRQGRAP